LLAGSAVAVPTSAFAPRVVRRYLTTRGKTSSVSRRRGEHRHAEP
jgi:hypothetical protein